MISLRELIGRVKQGGKKSPKIAWPGNVSLLRDFWGYNYPPDETLLSLRWQMRLMKGKYFHINLIRVGDDLGTEKRQRKIDGVAHILRQVYGLADVGVVRIEHYAISTELANGREVIDSDDEAASLTNEWTVSNDGLDIFLVARTWENEIEGAVTGGVSEISGSCDKDYAKEMTGCVVSIFGALSETGRVMAHEVGHYLGLPHWPDDADDLTEDEDTIENRKNLMFPIGAYGVGLLTDNQISIICQHCLMHEGN